jgi:hypothetical protein
MPTDIKLIYFGLLEFITTHCLVHAIKFLALVCASIVQMEMRLKNIASALSTSVILFNAFTYIPEAWRETMLTESAAGTSVFF